MIQNSSEAGGGLSFLSFFSSRERPLLAGGNTNADTATILDKTVEKIVYLDSIFLNIVAVAVLPSPPSPESNVVVYSKESLIPGRFWEATLNWGKRVFFPQRRRFGNNFVA